MADTFLPLPNSVLAGLLLAQADRVRRLGADADRSLSWDAADLLWTAALVGAPLVLIILGTAGLRLWRHFQRCSPLALFLELCRAHNLGWRDRLRLWRVSRQLRLASPERAFVSPEAFAAGRRDAADRRWAQLTRVLFGDEHEPPG